MPFLEPSKKDDLTERETIMNVNFVLTSFSMFLIFLIVLLVNSKKSINIAVYLLCLIGCSFLGLFLLFISSIAIYVVLRNFVYLRKKKKTLVSEKSQTQIIRWKKVKKVVKDINSPSSRMFLPEIERNDNEFCVYWHNNRFEIVIDIRNSINVTTKDKKYYVRNISTTKYSKKLIKKWIRSL